MSTLLSSPVTAAQQQRDLLLGALVGLARSTVNEPKTEDTDHVLAAGLRLAAKPEADTTALERMRNIVETEKHRVAPNCANCTMRAGRGPHPEARTSGSTFRAGTAPQHRADRRRNSERPICPRRGLGYNPAVLHRSARSRAMPRVTFWGNSR